MNNKMHSKSQKLHKITKPMMEKRRRARINNCLSQLKLLIIDALNKDTCHYSKLEKADILELTVKHIRNLQKERLTATLRACPTLLDQYRQGFAECASEVANYMQQNGSSLINMVASSVKVDFDNNNNNNSIQQMKDDDRSSSSPTHNPLIDAQQHLINETIQTRLTDHLSGCLFRLSGNIEEIVQKQSNVGRDITTYPISSVNNETTHLDETVLPIFNSTSEYSHSVRSGISGLNSIPEIASRNMISSHSEINTHNMPQGIPFQDSPNDTSNNSSPINNHSAKSLQFYSNLTKAYYEFLLQKSLLKERQLSPTTSTPTKYESEASDQQEVILPTLPKNLEIVVQKYKRFQQQLALYQSYSRTATLSTAEIKNEPQFTYDIENNEASNSLTENSRETSVWRPW